jgi:SOS-response transcriptional repressor LexA
LIPFQAEPEQVKRSGVVKKEGKFFLEINEKSVSPKAFALEVSDDSMNLAGIMKGDIVISELDRPCKHGQIVIAQHYQGKGAKTLIRKYEAPLLLPYSTLPMFKPLRMDDTNARLVSPVLKLIRTY